MLFNVTVELPQDTEDECNKSEPCQFLLGDYCVLFQDTPCSDSGGRRFKLKECPASGEKRYDQ